MKLMKAKINPTLINRIFLTHLHIDHSLEFPSLVFGNCLLGKKDKMNIYGPSGILDFYRNIFTTYPYERDLMPSLRRGEFEAIPHETNGGPVCHTENYQVFSVPGDHGIPSVAYRIEASDGIVVISGDTRPSKALIELAKGADLLVHECSFPDDMIEIARMTGHSVPAETGRVAKAAGVGKVVLTHLLQPCKGREEEIVKSINTEFDGEVVIGRDFLEIII